MVLDVRPLKTNKKSDATLDRERGTRHTTKISHSTDACKPSAIVNVVRRTKCCHVYPGAKILRDIFGRTTDATLVDFGNVCAV